MLIIVFVYNLTYYLLVYMYVCVTGRGGCFRIAFARGRGLASTGGGGRLQRSHTLLHLPEVF
jgi:hypothetical protein